MTRANVMILPSIKLQNRGLKPYYDYMPYFLIECFKEGDFSKAFENDEGLKEWIERQHLKMFFENEDVENDKILDLSGNGVKNNIPKNVEIMMDNYIDILERRKVYY